MPFVQRVVEPKFLSKTSLWLENGKPKVVDDELEAVINNTLSNSLRQLACLLLVADDIFTELGGQLREINKRSESLKSRISRVDKKVIEFDPKKVSVPESDICSFALRKEHYSRKIDFTSNLFSFDTRPASLKALYSAASKTPVAVMRQLDRWRRDGHRSSRFFMCTPVLGQKRKKIKCNGDIEIETRLPEAIEDLRRWTSTEALGDITVTPDCPNRIPSNFSNCRSIVDATDGGFSDAEGLDHKLPSPEEQVQVVALKFPSEVVPVDVSGKAFERMSLQRRSLMTGELPVKDGEIDKKKTKSRRPRSKRRNTLAGTDQKEIQNAVSAGESHPSTSSTQEALVIPTIKSVGRSKSSDIVRSNSKKEKESPENKRSHFNTLKQWSRNRYDRFMNRSNEEKIKERDVDEFNLYETVTMKRRRNVDKKVSHQRSSSVSSSEKSSVNVATESAFSGVINIAVRLRESSLQRRERRKGKNRDEPHSSSGNWSASSESGRNSIGSEITSSTTTQPKSTTSAATSSNSLNFSIPNSVCSRRKLVNASGASSVTSEGTLTPDIIQDLHEDGETSSVYSCDTEGYYTSFHMDSGLKTLKEEELPPTPFHSSNARDNQSSSAENEYELFGKGSTSTTTSSAGTICTTLKASESSKSLSVGPAVPERKSSLNSKSPESSLERDENGSDKTGTVKRSPAISKALHNMEDKRSDGGISPDSGHNTSSSPIESNSSPNGVRSGSEFEFSESSDMEAAERIERIRVKTTINSSRIPSMCIITPSQSDDESSQSSHHSHQNDHNSNRYKITKNQIKGTDKYISVNQTTGYATLETIQKDNAKTCTDLNQNTASINTNNSIRAPSPSGGTVIIREEVPNPKATQPIFKSTLLPLNNMFDKIKTNLSNLKNRREDKSPNRQTSSENKEDIDSGEYVTIADVRNNNKRIIKKDNTYVNDIVNKNLKTILSGKVRETEYVSLNELPCNDTGMGNPLSAPATSDSLERKKRQGARVTLNAEGKVMYSSDSLKRKKEPQSTFEPGPFVRTISPKPSPLPAHRTIKTVRAVNQTDRGVPDGSAPSTPQLGKVIIKASSDTNPEIVRMPPSKIVGPNTRQMSPKAGRGAYVHVHDAGKPQDKDRVLQSPTKPYSTFAECAKPSEMSVYQGVACDASPSHFYNNQYYLARGTQYQTLPAKKTEHYLGDIQPERSVTPDITRGLERNQQLNLRHQFLGNQKLQTFQYEHQNTEHVFNQKLGIPVAMPYLRSTSYGKPCSNLSRSYDDITPKHHSSEKQLYENIDEVDCSFKVSPIDPRNSGGFQSSTPSQNISLKAAVNLESKIFSPKKTTMSNEELYAVIHKSKKKMNIKTDEESETSSVRSIDNTVQLEKIKTPESGYLGDKVRTRLSWSPNNHNRNEQIDDKEIFPTNESQNRQSWTYSGHKKMQQTSRLDFKKLLLQKSVNLLSNTKKPSAVEQLKLSKQKIQRPVSPPQPPQMSILELSGSPRSLINRRFMNPPSSPKNSADKLNPPKLMSPRSQWRFANPRSDVLSSTILEDCREDETNSSGEKNASACSATKYEQKSNDETNSTNSGVHQNEPCRIVSIAERVQAQRVAFFQTGWMKSQFANSQIPSEKSKIPALETSF